MRQTLPARESEWMPTRANGQDWLVSWHPAGDPPIGTPHGAAGVCVTPDRRLVLISHDGEHWGFPAGRPEPDETPQQTLRRELREEACVNVEWARPLGYARSECLAGRERGLVLVRSYWLAGVEVGPWEPLFEIRHRRIVSIAEASRQVRDPDEVATRISFRALHEAGLG